MTFPSYKPPFLEDFVDENPMRIPNFYNFWCWWQKDVIFHGKIPYSIYSIYSSSQNTQTSSSTAEKQHPQRVDWVDRCQVEPPAEQVEKLTLRVQKAVQIHGFYGPQKPADGHIIGGA